MKRKTPRHILFVLILLFLLSFLALFNFLADPYNIFRNKKYMDIYKFPDNQYNLVFKAYKNFKCDTLVVGGSDLYTMYILQDIYSYFFNSLYYPYFQYSDQYEIIKNYIHFHPETKKVYLFVSTSSFFNHAVIDMPKIKGDNFNFEEYVFLLYSTTTLRFSFEKIINKILNKKNKLSEQDFSKRMSEFEYYPDNYPTIITDEELVKNLYETNIFYLKKTVDYLKQNNIDYQIVFVPYHSLYAAIISEYPSIKKTMDDVKRASVEISDKDVYDFFIVNKYTTCDITKNNYMYHDALHPNIIWGMKIFKIFHDTEYETDLFKKINRNNIEKHLAEQTQKVNEYKMKHKKYVDFNLELNKKQVTLLEEIPESYPISFKNAPNTVKQEIKTYERYNDSIEKLIKNGTPPRQGYFENEF